MVIDVASYTTDSKTCQSDLIRIYRYGGKLSYMFSNADYSAVLRWCPRGFEYRPQRKDAETAAYSVSEQERTVRPVRGHGILKVPSNHLNLNSANRK